jgi:hypothetical protein
MAERLSDWLALREAADAAARSTALTEAVALRLAGSDPVRAIDLGTGTGSNLRYLMPLLGPTQHWRVVDRDEDVLADLPRRMEHWAAARGCTLVKVAEGFALTGPHVDWRVEIRRADLLRCQEPGIFEDRQLVTASALLDLVSARWMGDVAVRCREAGALALFALTYDGRSRCVPVEPEDELVRELLNQHQRRRETGAGRAAGPDAATIAADAFAAVGYQARQEASDWTLSPDSAAMQRALIRGWADAAIEIASGEDAVRIRRWLARRLDHVDRGRSTIVVGHQDLAAWPV